MKNKIVYILIFVALIIMMLSYQVQSFADDGVEYLKKEADYLYQMGQYENAVELYVSIMKNRSITQDLAGILSFKAGRCYEQMNKLKSAVRYYYLSLRINKELHNYDALNTIYYRLGTALYNNGDVRSSVTAFENSFTISKGLKEDKLMALSALKLGTIYYSLGENGLSLRYFMHSLNYHTEQKNMKSVGVIMYYIGNIYLDEGRLEDAVYIWKKGIRILKSTGSDDWKVIRDKLLDIAD